MKKIVGSVATFAVLVLGSYYGTGLVTERTLKKDMEMINQTSGLSVEMVSYDRGLFTSKVKLTWQMQTPERLVSDSKGESTLVPSKTYSFDMPITIYHGPVIVADKHLHFGLGYANSQVALPDMYLEQFKQHFSEGSTIPMLDVSFFVTYLNKTHVHVDVPAFRLVMKKDNSQFEWLGMSSDHYFSSSMKHLNGDMTMNGIRMSKEASVLDLEKVTSTYDLHQSLTGLYLGDVGVDVPSLVVSQDGKAQFEAKQLIATSSSDVTDGLFASGFKVSFGKLIAHDKSYGPGQVDFSIKNLDAAVLADLNEKTNQIQQQTEAERQQAMLALLPELPKLFSKGAEIELSNLHVVMPDGPMDASLHLVLPKGDIGNPFQLMQKVEGQGKIKVPVVWLKEQLTRAAKEKLIRESEASAQQEAVSEHDVSSEAVDGQKNEAIKSQPVPVVADADVPHVDVSKESEASAAVPPVEKPVVDVDQQAAALASTRIDDLIKAGALVQSGNEYVIDAKLVAGQLSINGRSFHSGMLPF